MQTRMPLLSNLFSGSPFSDPPSGDGEHKIVRCGGTVRHWTYSIGAAAADEEEADAPALPQILLLDTCAPLLAGSSSKGHGRRETLVYLCFVLCLCVIVCLFICSVVGLFSCSVVSLFVCLFVCCLACM